MWGRGQRNKVMKYISGGAPESPLSMGPERPCYATVCDGVLSHSHTSIDKACIK